MRTSRYYEKAIVSDRLEGRAAVESTEEEESALFSESPEDKQRLHEVADYAVTASVLVGALTCFGRHAPELPLGAIVLLLFLYAVPAALSATYRTVVDKYYNQSRYRKDGKARARLCDRWGFRLAGYMLLACFSAVAFAIGAPSWDRVVWLLVWLAIPAYFAAYKAIYRRSLSNFDPIYAKMKAVRYSALAVGLAMGLIYAVLPTGGYAGLPEAFVADLETRAMYFSDSSSVLFREVEKLTSYSDYLTKYGWGYVIERAFFAAFVVKLALIASVFLGFANILGFCMLDSHEVLSVFRHMPEFGETSEVQKQRPGYLACLLGVWLVVSGALCAAEAVAEKESMRGGPTLVDRFLEDATEVLEVVPYIPGIKEEVALYEDYKETVEQIEAEHERAIVDAVNAYYDESLTNVGSYVEWCEGLGGGFSRTFAFVGEGFAVGAFCERVVDPLDRSAVDSLYAGYIIELEVAYDEWQQKRIAAGLVDGGEALDDASKLNHASGSLSLWPDWQSAESSALVRNGLLGLNAEGDIDGNVRGFIESQRERTIAEIEALSVVPALEVTME